MMEAQASIVLAKGPFRLLPTMPDVAGFKPKFKSQASSALFLFHLDLPSIGKSGRFEYVYVVTIIWLRTRQYVGMITLENSKYMSNAFCEFEESDGVIRHRNYGSFPEIRKLELFIKGTAVLLHERYGIAEPRWSPV